MDIEIITVTKKLAEKFLNENVQNRPLKPGLVDKYARDMANNRWTECVDPIVFYDDGTLANGQHRCWAIIESGVPQKFIIARGVPVGSALNIDTGHMRGFVDNARITGSDVTTNVAAVSRWIEWGSARIEPAPSYAVMKTVVDRHHEAAAWADNRLVGRGIRNGHIGGAVGRAWYIEKDKDRLARFCHVVSNGFTEGTHESAGVALRNLALNNMMNGVTSADARRDVFLKAQHAIRLFMRGKAVKTIRQVQDEAYPLKKGGK